MAFVSRIISENKAVFLTLVFTVLSVIWMLNQGVLFTMQLGTVVGIFGILALSLNLVIGYTGLLSIAHVGFFGFGAYVVAILTYDPPPELTRLTGGDEFPIVAMNFFAALLIAILIGGLVAFLLGITFSRFRDDFYALATLGFAVIAHGIFTSARYFTRGPFGINFIPAPSLGFWTFNDRWEYLTLVMIFLGLIALIAWYIVNTSFGRILTAIREDEKAIEVFGYRVTYFKLAVFVISGMMASVAGALFTGFTKIVTPSEFILLEGIIISSIVLIGGLATIWGSVLGALVYILMEEGLRFVPGLPVEDIGQIRIGILGLLLIVLMLFRPQGLVGKYRL